MAAFVLYSCFLLRAAAGGWRSVVTWRRMWMVSEVRQQSARSSTRTQGALGRAA